MTRERFDILLRKYIDQQLTQEELAVFFQEVALPENEAAIESALDNDFEGERFVGLSQVEERVQAYEVFRRNLIAGRAPAKSRYLVYRWVAAASVIIMIAAGAYWWQNAPRPDHSMVVIKNSQVVPGGNKATLTLANGRMIVLDSAANGALARQGNTQVIKLDNGELAYNADAQPGTVDINTLSTPRGGQYQVNLPDGSRVWLNAASSLTYPTAFTGKERTVTLTGEAYFEVAGNAAQPFYIKMPAPRPGGKDAKVEVLGTRFNINAYGDETGISTTLLEGAVKVTSEEQLQVLKPGQQALVSTGGSIQLIADADVELAMAWKNGEFRFRRTDITSIMNQLSRWYNFQVKYEGVLPTMRYSGSIGRNAKLTEVLEMLRMLTGARFEVNGNIVKVSFKNDH